MDADSSRAWLSGLHPCFACTLLSPTFPKSSLNFIISQLRALAILVSIPSTASFLRRRKHVDTQSLVNRQLLRALVSLVLHALRRDARLGWCFNRAAQRPAGSTLGDLGKHRGGGRFVDGLSAGRDGTGGEPAGGRQSVTVGPGQAAPALSCRGCERSRALESAGRERGLPCAERGGAEDSRGTLRRGDCACF